MKRVVVGVKIEPDEKARLLAEAKAAGQSLSEWCRGILLTGYGRRAALPCDVADHDEVLGLLSVAARAGDVQAMRHLEKALAPDPDAGLKKPLSALDELSARRKARTS